MMRNTFIALAIIPLAGWMGKATEHLAERTGEGIGGLLNATFGNAAEMIIALMALRKGQYEIVKASITGSIIRASPPERPANKYVYAHETLSNI